MMGVLFHNAFIPPPYFRQVFKRAKVAAVSHANGARTRTTPAPFRFAKAFRTKRFENLIFRKIFPVINSPECKLLAPWRTSCMTKWGAAKHEDENLLVENSFRRFTVRERTAGMHGVN